MILQNRDLHQDALRILSGAAMEKETTIAGNREEPMITAAEIAAELNALVGVETTYRNRVERGNMMKIPWAIDDRNPLWRDEDYARRTPREGLTASPSFVEFLRIGFRNFAPEDPLFAPPGMKKGGPPGVVGGQEVDYFRPVRIGDVITSRRKLVGVRQRYAKALHKDVVIRTSEQKFTNQHEEPVATLRATQLIIFDSTRPKPEEADPAEEPAAAVTNPVPVPEGPVDWNQVRPGVELPVLTKHPDDNQMAVWAGAVDDYNPIHRDPVLAQQGGYPGPIVFGPLICSFLNQLVTDWMGPEGWIDQVAYRHLAPAWVGEPMICRGRIVEKRVKEGRHQLVLRVQAGDAKGIPGTVGTVTVTLPEKPDPDIPRAVPLNRPGWMRAQD